MSQNLKGERALRRRAVADSERAGAARGAVPMRMEPEERAARSGGGRAKGALSAAIWVLWLPGTVFLVHLVFCGELDAYGRWEWTDEIMHLAGGYVFAVAVSRALVELHLRLLIPGLGRALRATLVFSLTATAAVLWELAEYASDRYFGTRTLGDVEDTLLDMALGLAGALAFLAVDRLCQSPSSTAP